MKVKNTVEATESASMITETRGKKLSFFSPCRSKRIQPELF
jgi:hypothetical protein